MKRAIVAVVAGLYAFCGLPYATRVQAVSDWSALVKDLTKSVVTIERDNNGTSCTGFIINSKVKKDQDTLSYVLTAAHCEASKLFADQAEAKVVAKNTEKDLLVLAVDHLDKPAMKLAQDNPKVGDEVASFGYGMGLEKPLFRIAHVSAETYIPYEGIGGPLFFVDGGFVGGQSGGCVINTIGEVVMMVQRSSATTGIGVGAETIRQKVGRYWEKPAAKP
jgi:S1-C subfamily serine protease